MLKRAWLNITRKKSKTILLLIILFIVANLILATISIKKATDEQVSYAKKTLGSQVTLSADMEKMRALRESSGDSNQTRLARPTANLADVEKIAESDYVKDYTYSITTSANASGFDVIETAINNDIKDRPGFGNFAESTGNVQVEGVNSYAYISDVQNKTMSLTSGTYFDEKTDDQVIISYDLADANNFKVGDSIKLINIDTSKTYTFKVIGIYDTETNDATENFGMISSSNKIYMNTTTAAKLLSTTSYNNGNYSVNNVIYYLDNAEHVNEFISEAKKLVTNLADNNLILSANTDAYDKMAGPIESVGDFANTILIIVVLASIGIITLIINNQIKDRKYEIGVLMSLGEKKKKIVMQFIIELLVITTMAIILSTATSSYLAKSMSKSLLDKQVAAAKEDTSNNFGRPGMFGRTKNINTITTLNVSANMNDYIMLFGIGYLIIIGGMIIPVINIVKYDPKTILTGRE